MQPDEIGRGKPISTHERSQRARCHGILSDDPKVGDVERVALDVLEMQRPGLEQIGCRQIAGNRRRLRERWRGRIEQGDALSGCLAGATVGKRNRRTDVAGLVGDRGVDEFRAAGRRLFFSERRFCRLRRLGKSWRN